MEWLLNQTAAMSHALEDTRAVFSVKGVLSHPLAFTARLSDLMRSTSFLLVETHSKTLEYYSRITLVGREGSRG